MDDDYKVIEPNKEADKVVAHSNHNTTHSKRIFSKQSCDCENHGCKCGRRSNKLWSGIIIAVVIVVVIVVGFLMVWRMNSEARAIDTNEYQAVFLTNGQVYFGKLVEVSPNYLKLTDIYYLQVQASSSQTAAASQLDAASTSGTSAKDVQLVKLGNELQGPEDMMAINREQVLFWENLKPSGRVTQAIDNYLKTQGN